MLSKIKRDLLLIWEKTPWPVLAAVGVTAFYGWLFVAAFPAPRHSEWQTVRMFSSSSDLFPAMSSGWPVIPELADRLFYLCGLWSVRFCLAFNYLVFLADLVLLYRLIVKAAGSPSCLPLFFVPFFSDINAPNLMQTTASQIYLTVLFGLIAAEIGFQRMPTYRNIMLFLLFLTLSVFSMNALFALIVITGWAITELLRRNWRSPSGAFILFVGVLNLAAMKSGIALLDFTASFSKAVQAFSAVLTGFDIATTGHYFLISPVVWGLGYLFYKKRLWRDREALMLLTLVCAFFFSAAGSLVLPDRFPFSFIHTGCGFMVFLFPIVFTLLRAVRPVFVYICILAVSGYSATFSHQVFQVEKEFREMTAQCVGEYVAGTDQPESCKILKDPHLPSVLDETEGVDLPFIRKSV